MCRGHPAIVCQGYVSPFKGSMHVVDIFLILFRREMCYRLTVMMIRLLCLRVMMSLSCFTSVDFIVLHVYRYMTRSVLQCVLRARLTLCLVYFDIYDCDMRMVTSLTVVVICAMHFVQLTYTWLMRRRGVGIRKISSMVDGLGVLVM